MNLFLNYHKCWDIVTIAFTEQDEVAKQAMTNAQRKTYDDSIERHSKAPWFIMQEQKHLFTLKQKKPKLPKNHGSFLETTYQDTTKVRNVKLQTLRRNFETLFMKDTKSVDQFMTLVNHTVNQLSTHSEDILDQKVIE